MLPGAQQEYDSIIKLTWDEHSSQSTIRLSFIEFLLKDKAGFIFRKVMGRLVIERED